MVEFAFISPLLVLLLLGAVFFGYDSHMYDRLEESVRAGSRYASIQPYDAHDSGQDPAPLRCACANWSRHPDRL
jgi:Flp pilus assembly protein TadG